MLMEHGFSKIIGEQIGVKMDSLGLLVEILVEFWIIHTLLIDVVCNFNNIVFYNTI